MIRPEDFGAVGDGRADDTAPLQAALDRAATTTLSLGGRTYATSATLLVESGTTIEGGGAVFRARADDRPVLASRAWTDRRAATRGRTRIAGLRIEAGGRGAAQDGIVLHDFWSELADLEIDGVGGRGLVLTATDRGGTPVAGTLVENRVRRCIVRNSRGTAFFMGEPANGKLTDGELSDCIGMAADGSTAPIVSLGHAAGWTLRNIHTYGGSPATAIEVRQGYFTRIEGLYVEGFTAVGLALPQMQTDVSVANVQIVADRLGAGAAFVAVSAHRDFPQPTVQFTNVSLANLGQGRGVALDNPGERVRIAGAALLLTGPGAARVRPATEPLAGRRIVTWVGRAPRQVTIASRSADQAFAEAHLISVTGRSSDGTVTTAFAGMAHWSGAAPDGQGVVVDLVPFGAPMGFQQAPVASFARDGGRLVLTLAFTPVASGAGQMAID